MSKKITKLDTNRKLKQSNNLVEARYKLTVYEQRMIIAICSQIGNYDDELPIVKIRVDDLAAFCQFTGTNKYNLVKTVARKLRNRSLEYTKPEGGWYITGWINSADYKAGQGIIEFSFDERIKSELLQLQSAFVLTDSQLLMKFDRDYSVRMYFLLKKWLKLRDITKELKFFRERFELGKTYDKLSNLKDKVIEPALKEINEKSDIKVRHEYIKEGRAFTKIRFIIEFKDKSKQAEEAPKLAYMEKVIESKEEKEEMQVNFGGKNKSADNSKATVSVVEISEKKRDEEKAMDFDEQQQADYEKLIQCKVVPKTARKLVKQYDHERIDRNYNGVSAVPKNLVKNLAGLLKYAIENDHYKGQFEEQQKLKEQVEKKKKEEWEAAEKAEQEKEKQRKKQNEESEKLKAIRANYTKEELIEGMKKIKEKYKDIPEGEARKKKIENELHSLGIPLHTYILFETNEEWGENSIKILIK